MIKDLKSFLVCFVKTWQGACALVLFLLPFFFLNAHEFFPKETNCFNWMGYNHCASSFNSYYEFVYRLCYYLSICSWLACAYLYSPRLSKVRILYVVAFSFCVARIINVVSSKEIFGWHDEIINFLIVFSVLRFCIYLFKTKNKEIKLEDAYYIIDDIIHTLESSEMSKRKTDTLYKNNRIEKEDYYKRIEKQNAALHQQARDIKKVIADGI